MQDDHFPDNVQFPDDSLMVRGTRHVKCYSYHAHTSVTVSGGVRMQQYMIPNHILNGSCPLIHQNYFFGLFQWQL